MDAEGCGVKGEACAVAGERAAPCGDVEGLLRGFGGGKDGVGVGAWREAAVGEVAAVGEGFGDNSEVETLPPIKRGGAGGADDGRVRAGVADGASENFGDVTAVGGGVVERAVGFDVGDADARGGAGERGELIAERGFEGFGRDCHFGAAEVGAVGV